VESTRDDAQAVPTLQGPLADVDVLVLGGGIVGITTAYLLRKSGLKVGLLESGPLCEGVTGHTTAKLTSQHGLCYAPLIKKARPSHHTPALHRFSDRWQPAQHGLEAARRYGAGQEAGKEWIASESAKLGIDCDFERCETFIFGETPMGAALALQEAEAASEAGLPAYYTAEQLSELSFHTEGACGFRDQAVFHPRKWLLGLAAQVAAAGGEGAGSYIATHVRATGLREASAVGLGNRHLVLTTRGEVRAQHVVVATHYPIFDRGLFFARLAPARDNCVAGPVDAAAAPRNAYWSADTAMSFRSTPYEATEPGKRLVVRSPQQRFTA
jgi:glycine/D-amino acid oxidase-like deaminating enzyme